MRGPDPSQRPTPEVRSQRDHGTRGRAPAAFGPDPERPGPGQLAARTDAREHARVLPTIRPLTMGDADRVLALNEAVVHKLAPLDLERFAWFVDHAACAWAADVDGELAGFVLVLAPGVAYESDNYRWFSERYEDFRYLDRVAIDEPYRRSGVGSAIYREVEAQAAALGLPVLLEVNEVPPNEASLAFHAARGYRPVGTLDHDGGAKVVRLLAWDPPVR